MNIPTIAAALFTSATALAGCPTPAPDTAPCDVWHTQQAVIDGALIAAPRNCTYNVSYTTPERCATWGGHYHPLGCYDIDPNLAVSIWIPGP